MASDWFATIDDWDAGGELLVRRRYGVIEAAAGQAVAVHLRPWPKLIAWPEIWPVGPAYHAGGRGDRCLLYYNQPRRFSNFLALRYIVSTPGASLATIRMALEGLDRLAQLKRTDALLCDAANLRLTDRVMRRFGWTSHKPQRWHRNYIKRFYGEYPRLAAVPSAAELELAAC